jgi:hypothetical protein
MTMRDLRRITLIARGANASSRGWDASKGAENRVIFAETFSILRGALDHASHDVDRLIIDGTASGSQFLELLTSLPHAFIGDVLFIRDGETSYLSTVGRGDGRLLYALTSTDVQFYLETHRLIAKAAIAA